MGDQNAGAVFQNQIQRLLDLPLGEGVDTGGGLVQDKDGGLVQQHTQQRNHLPLPHGKTAAALPDLAVQPIGQGLNPFPGADLPGGTLDIPFIQIRTGC